MKKIFRISATILLVSLVALFASCEKDYYVPDTENVPDPTDTIFYSIDIQPIWDANCTGGPCHGGIISPNLTPSKSYDALLNGNKKYVDQTTPETSIIYTKITGGESMEKYTQPGDAETILQWIEQGALNN